jgi:hypothetical protein
MPAVPSQVKRERGPRGGKKYFTLAEARRALPLVKRIAHDLQAAHKERIRLHEQMNASRERPMAELEALAAQFEKLTDHRDLLLRELAHIGVQLKDASLGLLDFPAMHEGREVLLCWKGDEETIMHWHEVWDGFEGRMPVAMLGGG